MEKKNTIKENLCDVNLMLKTSGLVMQTWGNASTVDRERGKVFIKPSGVDYEKMHSDDIVVTDFSGKIVEGTLAPSVDLYCHLELYTAFPQIGGIVHTHSHYASCFAQARRAIPCFGTTHADYFYGDIPLLEPLEEKEVDQAYESNTGKAIIKYFTGGDPMTCPAVLIAGHGPFVWGTSLEEAFENAEVLEEVARMAMHTLLINPGAEKLEDYLVEKHFLRKHGRHAYYGQNRANDQ